MDKNLNEQAQSSSPSHKKMVRQIKSWGIILIVIGVMQIVSSDFLSNGSWGLFLIIVGSASFYFRSPAMFIVYGTTLGWAAVSNLLSSAGGWVMYSIVQVMFTYQTFRQFFQYRSQLTPPQLLENDDNLGQRPMVDKAAKPFPWMSFGFGLVSLLGLVTIFSSAILFAVIAGGDETPLFIDYSEGIVIHFAILGFATGLASLLSGYKYKWFSIIGMIAGGLVLLIEVGLSLIW